jgi:inorganic pyrophosphatase
MAPYSQLLIIICAGLAVQGLAMPNAVGPAPGLDIHDDYTVGGNDKNLMKGVAPRNADGTINVIVEIPTGTVAKWEVTKSNGAVKPEFEDGAPREVRYLGYPGNYGMLPRTLISEARGGEGDPLDVLVLGPAVPRGSIVRAKVLGVLRLLDRGRQDDKIITVLPSSPLAGADDPEQMDRNFPGALSIVKIWFENYKGHGEIASDGYLGPAAAFEVIETAREDFVISKLLKRQIRRALASQQLVSAPSENSNW